MRGSQPLEDLREENSGRGNRTCKGLTWVLQNFPGRERQNQGKEQGFVCDREMCTSLLGHDKELILILGNMESCKKVLVKMNRI